MRDRKSRTALGQMTDDLAAAIRARSTRETIEAAEELKRLAGNTNDPFTARLLEETLEDFSHLPDYSEAIFRRRAERVIRPHRRMTIIGHARQISKALLLVAGKRRQKHG